MGFLTAILPTICVLGILIIIHEFGHFLACRFSKVRVEKFSIGFGPEIFHYQGKETRYVVSLLPLGGFVKPAGETVSELEAETPKPGDYLGAPLLSRIFIVVAGVLMNYFLAFVLFIAIFMIGRPIPGTTVGGFVDGYPAKASGLQAGDKITSINDQVVNTWAELTRALELSPAPTVSVSVQRAGQPMFFSLSPKVDEIKDMFGKPIIVKRLGITPSPEASAFEQYGFLESVKASAQTVWVMTAMTHKAIYYLALGKLSLKTMSGPIGIVSMTGDAAKLGLPYLLQLTATLSISLAVINLLPIPALDGGHLLFLLIEGIRRKRVSLEAQEKMTQVGFMLLMVLMVFVFYNDLVNFEVFEKVKNLFQK